jgi:predicted CxxxxCH...CXXCH cytochrome family protein
MGCVDERTPPAPDPVYKDEIAQLLAARCRKCHGAGDAGTSFRVDSYLHSLGCAEPGAAQQPPTEGDAGAPLSELRDLLDALDRKDHAELLTPSEQARLRDWVLSEAPLRRAVVHEPGMLNPRSPNWHGRLAAQDRFIRLTDSKQTDACGRCHAGSPVTPLGIAHSAPGAPACTSCHTEPEGVLACGTCHGDGARRAYGRRDACDAPLQDADAHQAHLEQSRLGGEALQCATCHPAADATLRGTHADGTIDVVFEPGKAGKDARFDRSAGECAVRCHNQGGARARPRFDERDPMACGDCHKQPPSEHYAGACNTCHAESDAKGSALRATTLHLNGKVDVADGTERCGSCHGSGSDPMPATPSHLLHRTTTLTKPIACSECHVMPQAITSAGHLDVGEVTPADVVFGPLASARDQQPTYDRGTCRNIACHGAGLPDGIERALRWDERSTSSCNGCHAVPPSGTHPQASTCASVLCHGSEVRVGTPAAITESGRALHIDGTIDVAR